jgi:hypothetical protein
MLDFLPGGFLLDLVPDTEPRACAAAIDADEIFKASSACTATTFLRFLAQRDLSGPPDDEDDDEDEE